MKAVMKHYVKEMIECFEVPIIAYVYETSKVVAMNPCAIEILGDNSKDVKVFFKSAERKKIKDELLENGSETFFERPIIVKGKEVLFDIQVNVICVSQEHLILCIFEHSYKSIFANPKNPFIPGLIWKDKSLNTLGTNLQLRQDVDINAKDGRIQAAISTAQEAEKKVLEEQLPQFSTIQQVFGSNRDGFAKATRIPIINTNGTCVGMLAMYSLLMDSNNREDMIESILRKNSVLEKAIERTSDIVIVLRENAGESIEYISPNISRLGYDAHELMRRGIRWKSLIAEKSRTNYDDWKQALKEDSKAVPVCGYYIRNRSGGEVYVEDTTMEYSTRSQYIYRMARVTVTNNVNHEEKNWDKLRKQTEQILSDATDAERMNYSVFYQPIVDHSTLRPAAYEAFIRWSHDGEFYVNPLKIIPVSEYIELLGPLGEYIFKEAFMKCKELNDDSEQRIRMHINVFTYQFLQPDFLEVTKRLIKETQVDPECIVLELREVVAKEDRELFSTVIQSLKQLGFKIALEDFGSDAFSLQSLKELDFDYVKINEDYMKNYGNEEFNPALLNALVDLIHSLKKKVIISGIENKEQLNFLIFSEVDYYQGYYFGYPKSKENIFKEEVT
ncbi:MAG: EAL domain-containing protein [Lachnospiraceae bacterium]|nr:EAL domain-containing protein [Lachnospiraceae bacterium]